CQMTLSPSPSLCPSTTLFRSRQFGEFWLTLGLDGWSTDTDATPIETLASLSRLSPARLQRVYARLFAARRLALSCKRSIGVTSRDRKSTRLNSSHQIISYAIF